MPGVLSVYPMAYATDHGLEVGHHCAVNRRHAPQVYRSMHSISWQEWVEGTFAVFAVKGEDLQTEDSKIEPSPSHHSPSLLVSF